MTKGFAYITWQIENQPFAAAHAVTPRYIAQETQRLLLTTDYGPRTTDP